MIDGVASGPEAGSGAASGRNVDAWLGALALVLGFVVAFLWAPLDSGSGFVERIRRGFAIGDALAPAIAGLFVAAGGLLLLLGKRAGASPAPGRDALRVLGFALGITVASLLVMRWAGPLAVELARAAGADVADYRLLRDTTPWKHVGFSLGGYAMVAGLAILCQSGRGTPGSGSETRGRGLGAALPGAAVAAFIAVLALILVFDVPFDDLLLPPNGDV